VTPCRQAVLAEDDGAGVAVAVALCETLGHASVLAGGLQWGCQRSLMKM